MANSVNTFIVVLESSKAKIFSELIIGKNYHFQDCKLSPDLEGSVQDTELSNFYKINSNAQTFFCVIKISQVKFLELEKIINFLDGAIESIEWPKTNLMVTFDPTMLKGNFGEVEINMDTPSKNNNFVEGLFSVILYGFILHDIWAGLVLILIRIIKTHKNNQFNQSCIFGGGFAVLVGIICNSMIGNLVLTQLGGITNEYFDWIKNLQLIDIFTKNDTLPLNQILAYYNINVFTFYLIILFGFGFILQITKYIIEITSYLQFSNLKLSTLRFYWLSTFPLFGFVSFIYFRLNMTNNLFWIPVIIFVMLTFLNQPGNKIKEYLFGNFGVWEYVKSFFKILSFGIIAIIGLVYFQLTNELNAVFNNFFLRGWNYNTALILNILAQSLLTYIIIWISFWGIKYVIKIAK
jgi:hypothetical protein